MDFDEGAGRDPGPVSHGNGRMDMKAQTPRNRLSLVLAPHFQHPDLDLGTKHETCMNLTVSKSTGKSKKEEGRCHCRARGTNGLRERGTSFT